MAVPPSRLPPSELGAALRAGAPQSLRSDVDRIAPAPWTVALRLARLVLVVFYFLAVLVFERIFRGWTVARRQDFGARRIWLEQRSAERLRRLIQGLGGTAVKVGQQLAIRADLLPPIYCRELSKLLDQVGGIEPAYVREVVEKRTGRPLEDIFDAFDFDPIGSASVSCVYKAVLGNGDRVAVKIRRPGIVRSFKADLKAFDWLTALLEGLTLIRPGISASLRSELRQLLLEELDFRIEARYQELFQVYIERWKALHMSAPAIYPKLCGEDLIVSELIDDAVSIKEILAVLEVGGSEARAWLDAWDLCPKKIARRLIQSSHYQFYECPFFHGDPHPANILVRPGNRIVLIDFGACGVFAEGQRLQLRQMAYYQRREDIGGMVQCVINLMEPLPPIDIHNFQRELEAAWWQGFYGIKSKHSEWWERTSFRLWTALLRLVQKHKIPVPNSVLRMIRATLLYDTVGAQLYPRLDVFEEFAVYSRFRARGLRRQAECWAVRQLVTGPDPQLFVQAKRIMDVADGFLFEAQRFFAHARPNFGALVGKGFELVLLGIKWLLWVGISTLVTGAVVAWDGFRMAWKAAQDPALMEVSLGDVDDIAGGYKAFVLKRLDEPGLQLAEWAVIVWAILLLFSTFKVFRHAWYRLSDKDLS